MKELVSIIIPVYNRENLVKATIDSILNQTYLNWELLLVDDHSTDDSLRVMQMAAKEDIRIKVMKRPADRPAGGNAARNFGYEQSVGSFVNWFDSDDIMHPEFIERKLKAFKDIKYDIVFSRTIRTNFMEKNIPDKRLKCSKDFLQDYIIRKISWYLPDPMLKRSFLESKSLFDENLLAGQDRDFYIRLFAQKLPNFKILDFYGTYYRIHETSISEKLYREGNTKMQISHYNSLLNQIKILKQNGKISPVLKEYYLNELKKRFPAIIRSNSSISAYLKNLASLSVLNKSTVRVWSQIFPAYISFITIGKGERFLK